jgi:hypothetical protein
MMLEELASFHFCAEGALEHLSRIRIEQFRDVDAIVAEDR